MGLGDWKLESSWMLKSKNGCCESDDILVEEHCFDIGQGLCRIHIPEFTSCVWMGTDVVHDVKNHWWKVDMKMGRMQKKECYHLIDDVRWIDVI